MMMSLSKDITGENFSLSAPSISGDEMYMLRCNFVDLIPEDGWM